MQILRTERTVVGRITLDDAPFFVALMNSPGWLRFIGDRGIAGEADARRYLEEGFMKSYEERGFGYYVVRTETDGTPAGVCGFLKKPALDNPDFGFAFLPEHAGRGLAFESCRAVLDYGVRTFGFGVLDAVTRPDNDRSMRLLEKCGFRRVGIVPGSASEAPDLLFRWPGGPEPVIASSSLRGSA